MSFLQILSVSLGAVLAENVVFTNFLGINPFIKDSCDLKTAFKTGVAVIITLVLSAFFAYFAERLLIAKLEIEYLRTFILILVVGGVIYGTELILKKKNPKLNEKLGISFNSVYANSAVIGVMLLNAKASYGFFAWMAMSALSGAGFLVAIVLFAAIREKMKYSGFPKCMEGLPIILITAGLIGLAFMGFQGMKII